MDNIVLNETIEELPIFEGLLAQVDVKLYFDIDPPFEGDSVTPGGGGTATFVCLVLGDSEYEGEVDHVFASKAEKRRHFARSSKIRTQTLDAATQYVLDNSEKFEERAYKEWVKIQTV